MCCLLEDISRVNLTSEGLYRYAPTTFIELNQRVAVAQLLPITPSCRARRSKVQSSAATSCVPSWHSSCLLRIAFQNALDPKVRSMCDRLYKMGRICTTTASLLVLPNFQVHSNRRRRHCHTSDPNVAMEGTAQSAIGYLTQFHACYQHDFRTTYLPP